MAPDPFTEIRIQALHATRGPNFWSRRSVTRMDLAVGPFDDISSAQVPGFTDALLRTMPGLEEHRCSVGERGGFILRLRRGTYPPHIIEHVALELQTMVGHDVGYGRTRGGDEPGEYTLVFEHMHEQVGLRAAALALETVQHALAGTLQSVDHAVAELESLAAVPAAPPLHQHVLCGITGGEHRAATRHELSRSGVGTGELVIDVAPGYLLRQGLPYSRSRIGIILDAAPTDVPERYRDPELAQRLVAVLADGVERNGFVIVPAKEWEVQDLAREAGCLVGVFAADADITTRDRKCAYASAWVENGRIMVEQPDGTVILGALRDDAPAAAQVAAAFGAHALQELRPGVSAGAGA